MAPSVTDAIEARGQAAGLLKDAVDTLSENQTLNFVPYVRVVLPADRYVFWVRANQISPSALLNVMGFNTSELNQVGGVEGLMSTLTIQGSVHYAVDMRQEESTSFTINRIAFTSEGHIQQFNIIGPEYIYIASFRGTRFAFSSKGMFYEQMKLWHYEGDAIYPFMDTQIIDDSNLLDTSKTIVSNSLPSWLSLQYYDPPYPVEIPMPRFPLYPSFLSLQNMVPPYGTVHIGPDDTDADQAIPDYDRTLSQRQLSRDKVKITLYGLNDSVAQDWLAATLGFIRDAGEIGLSNVPNLKDGKVTQKELLVIAQQKIIQFEVSYNQEKMRDVARQLIKSVVPPIITIDQRLYSTLP